MIVKVETLTAMDEFNGISEVTLRMKLDAIENLIRSYTNNNFQNRSMRIPAIVEESKLIGYCPFFKVGDTLQVSQSLVNDGLYVISDFDNATITVDGDLFDCSTGIVTKVIYPPDIQKGVIDLMLWEQDNRHKVGIKSESISRHSVTYYDQDASNQVMGYPVSLLGFLKPYMKARF